MSEDLQSEIEDVAAGPRSGTTDGVTVNQHSLPDLIQADRYLRNKTLRSNPLTGLGFLRLLPPGMS